MILYILTNVLISTIFRSAYSMITT